MICPICKTVALIHGDCLICDRPLLTAGPPPPVPLTAPPVGSVGPIAADPRVLPPRELVGARR
ncbi:MAG TPA: hypothetical protein VH951_10315 [Dehalococcoidia bacterium]